MKMIISPAKKMNADPDGPAPRALPKLLEHTERLRDYLCGRSLQELKQLLVCNEQIAQLNYSRYQTMDLHRNLTPALLAYEGIQYRYMAPRVFTAAEYEYVEAHLRILSGFYGLLRPFDGVTPYRLEMQAKLKTPFCASLYEFWGDTLAMGLTEGDAIVLDLASEEYSRAVRPFLGKNVRCVKAVFGSLSGGNVVEKGVHVKMARGELVRWMAQHRIEAPEEITHFDGLGYSFRQDLSNETTYMFIKSSVAVNAQPQIKPGTII